MLASPPLRGLRDRFAHPYQTWYECAVKATTIYQQGAMLAPIRLTNAGSCPSRQRDCVATAARSAETKGTAQLPLRGQVRRKETHPLPTSTPPPPLRGLRGIVFDVTIRCITDIHTTPAPTRVERSVRTSVSNLEETSMYHNITG